MENKTTIIAECCQNHNGNKDILKEMIHTAAENGADYVKIQAIRSRELTQRSKFENGETDANGKVTVIKRPYNEEFERLAKVDLNSEDEYWFVEECRVAGVLPMTTVFTRSGVREVEDMGYAAVKIASYDCGSLPLLQDVKERWDKIFVSTGATFDEEISEAVKVLNGSNYELLHCVTIYPTPLEEVHMNRLDYLRKYSSLVGYSDHSKPAETDLWASKIAIAMGASCIERHYTVLGPNESKDGPVSITPTMLKELIEFARFNQQQQWEIIKKDFVNWRITLGNAQRELSPAELLNRDYYRGRFASKIGGRDRYNWEHFQF